MRCRGINKDRLAVAVLASLLVLSTLAVFNSSSYNVEAQPPKLQFPKSQQADLMAINSDSAPTTTNFNITVPGYTIQPVLWNLTLPSAITFDDTGRNMFLSEAGYAYGELHNQE
jgi:hypothetical protein